MLVFSTWLLSSADILSEDKFLHRLHVSICYLLDTQPWDKVKELTDSLVRNSLKLGGAEMQNYITGMLTNVHGILVESHLNRIVDSIAEMRPLLNSFLVAQSSSDDLAEHLLRIKEIPDNLPQPTLGVPYSNKLH